MTPEAMNRLGIILDTVGTIVGAGGVVTLFAGKKRISDAEKLLDGRIRELQATLPTLRSVFRVARLKVRNLDRFAFVPWIALAIAIVIFMYGLAHLLSVSYAMAAGVLYALGLLAILLTELSTGPEPKVHIPSKGMYLALETLQWLLLPVAPVFIAVLLVLFMPVILIFSVRVIALLATWLVVRSLGELLLRNEAIVGLFAVLGWLTWLAGNVLQYLAG